MSAQAVVRLQTQAGNAAVARLIAQRTTPRRAATASAPPRLAATTASTTGGGPARDSASRNAALLPAAGSGQGVQRLADGAGSCPAPPVAPMAADPRADPRFAGVESQVKGSARDLRKHPSGKAEAKKTQDAAVPPGDDKASQAKAAQAEEMAQAKPKGFDKAAFVAAVKQAIAKAAPKNLDEADKFAGSGKADAVKGEVLGKVTEGKTDSAKDVAEKTKQAPDPSAAKEKPVTPLKEQPAPQPPAVDGAKAMPAKAPPEQTDLRAGPCEVKAMMAQAEVTEEHLEKSNEPQMQDAAKAKKEADAHAAAAPEEIRQKEEQVLKQQTAAAQGNAQAAVAAMAGTRRGATGQVAARQSAAKAQEEADRARVSADINAIYDKTKGEVEGILNGLDAKVTAEFDKGEGEARREFTAKHKADMEAYKDKRYSGPAGWARWTADLFMDLPAEANKIFEDAKKLYESKMEGVISTVADLIGKELGDTKDKITEGRKKIKEYVDQQPKHLQKLAGEAAQEMSGKFDQLESDVDAKQESLVEDLAQRYTEARNAVDEEVKAEQEKNKGLVSKAKDAVGESVQAILKLKDLFMGLLSRAASAFNDILKDPLKFVGNFMNAVKQGFLNFADNILEHLKKGLQGWLFGQLADAGIELPDKLDAMGILKMIASLLRLTWDNIKSRLVAKVPWLAKIEQAWEFLESKVETFKVLAAKGVAGLWDMLKEKVGDLKQMVVEQIKTFVVERIVKAGITWVLGMLNPAGALVKIVQAVVSVVQWIMERGQQLGELIGSIIDAVKDVAAGGGGGVPAKIEGALSKAVPIVISFLASLLGLGGISDKVKSIIASAQEMVGKAIDWVINGALKVAKPLLAAAGKLVERGKAALARGKAWVKDKVDRAKAWGRRQVDRARAFGRRQLDRLRGRGRNDGAGDSSREDSNADNAAAVHAARLDADWIVAAPGATANSVRSQLPRLAQTHKVASAALVSEGGDKYHVHVQAIGEDTESKELKDDNPGGMEGARKHAQALRKKAQDAAPNVQVALQAAAASCGGRLSGVDKQIKEEDSLAKKILDRAGGENATAEKLRKEADKINDALRYTAVLSVDQYMRGHSAIRTGLASAGFPFKREGNAWAEPERFGHTYRGINMTFLTQDGMMFELQLHTEESLGVKEQHHDKYKEMQDANTSPARREELRQEIIGYVKTVPVPEGADVRSPQPGRRGRR